MRKSKEGLHKKKLPEGYLLATAFQKAGKGQLNRSWESYAGENILASVYFSRKSISSKEQNALSFAVALAIFQTVEHFANRRRPSTSNGLTTSCSTKKKSLAYL
jgi:BirA family biotin operon repressor/biotin-[acetyl-CoA-carboxylase] ligase